MSDTPVELYLILGAAGSDRRRVLADLAGEGLPPGARAAVLLAEGEKPAPADEALRAAGATVLPWKWRKPELEITVPPESTHLFLVADGRANPVDQIEALRDWLSGQGGVRLARVIFCANARLLQAQPVLGPWFEACAHFADVMLVTHPEGIAAQWLAGFARQFRDRAFPFFWEVVRNGTVQNPALILTPEARRVAQVFDEEMELADESDEEVAAAKPENDPFFARTRGGSRVVDLPDIGRFL